MIKNAPFGARFLMKSGSGNEEIVTGAQITQGEGYAKAQAFAGTHSAFSSGRRWQPQADR